MEPKQKQHSVVDVTGDRSKVQCCKKQYCIGAWNVRSTHQGKLEVVKQEMERVNTDILGIIELNNRMNSVNFQGKPFNFSFFSITGWGIDLDNCDIEWFALEMNRDHSVVFEIASKYCISDSFVNHDGFSISSKGFLPAVVDIMVI